MNVLVITPYYYPNIVGGAEISSQLIAEGLSKRGHHVTVLTIGDYEKEERINGVTVQIVFNKKMFGAWSSVLDERNQTIKEKIITNFASLFVDKKEVARLKHIIAKGNYDVAILNTNEECFQRSSLWKALNDLDIKTILTIRDPLLLEKKIGAIEISSLYKFIIKLQMKWITKYAAPSQYMFKLYEDNGFVFNQKKVIYNSVDIDIVKDIKEKDNSIIYAGGIVEKKGVKTLLKAFKELENDYPEYILYCIGRGELVEELSKERNVILIPWLEKEELYKYIQKAKVLVLPSEWPEAFGRVIIEAVFNGTLAIGSDAGAIPEIFGEFKRYVFEQKNAEELLNCLRRVLKLNRYEYQKEISILQSEWEKYNVKSFLDSWEAYL